MTELRIIARCALILAGSLACAAAQAQAVAGAPSAAASAADRAQKETDRTLYWIRVLAEKPAPKAAAAPKPVAAAPQVAKAAPAADRVKVAAATPAPATPDTLPANTSTASVVTAAPPSATAPAVPLPAGTAATNPAANPAAMPTSGGLDAGVAAPALAGALAAPTLTPPPVDIPPAPEVEEPDPGLIMTRSADPQFPMNTMKRLRKGQVEVRFEVGADGQVDVVSVVKSTNPGLNESALQAVRQWQFKPTPHGHTAVVDLAFDLDA